MKRPTPLQTKRRSATPAGRRPASLAIRRAVRCLAAALGIAGVAPQAPAQTLPAGCVPASPASCEYAAASHAIASADFLFRDPARDDHPVPFRVRYPTDLAGPVPVVIWNHGLGASHWVAQPETGPWISAGQLGSVRRSESFARAGYVVVHVGRMPVENPGRDELRLCARARWPSCAAQLGNNVHGPQNVAYVVDLLARGMVTLPGFAGTLDTDRIVVGGWSGGTQIAMNVAGAYQRFGALRIPPTRVPGVVAFFADAPRRPAWACTMAGPEGDSGFQADSFDGIDARPFLFSSSRGDVGPDRCPPSARIVAWQAARPGEKYLAWSDTTLVDHGTVDLTPDGCDTPAREYACRTLESLGVAYLDAVVKGLPDARAWLDSDVLAALTAGELTLYRR